MIKFHHLTLAALLLAPQVVLQAADVTPSVRNGAPIFAPAYTIVNAVASRTFRLGQRRTVQVQLNVNNLLENDQRLFLDGDDSGFHIYRFQQPRSWGLSATLNF